MQPDFTKLKPVGGTPSVSTAISSGAVSNPAGGSQPNFANLKPVTTDTSSQSGGTSGPFGTTQDAGGLLKNPITSLQNIGNNAVNNTINEGKSAFNISDTSYEDFANQQNQANDFGLTGIQQSDFSSPFLQDVATQGLKGLANVPIGTASMIGNIGTFLWNANVHPLKTIEKVASDPVGFAFGLIPDSLKQVASGVLSAGKDGWEGDWSKAGSDLGSGIKNAWTAFLDNPVQEVLKYSLVGDLLEAPAIVGGEMGAEDAASAGTKSLKNVPGNVADMTKSIYKPYSAAWDVAKTGAKNIKEEGLGKGLVTTGAGILQDVTKTLKNTFNTVKTSAQMFTQGGRAMILATQAENAFKLTKSNMDVNDYESQLQKLDANTPEAQALQVKLDQAKLDKQTAEQNFSGLQYTMANALDKMLGKKYTDTNSISSDLQSNLSGSKVQTEASYKNSLYKQNGTPNPDPINIRDVSSFTSALRNRADVLGANMSNGADAADLRTFADGLDLRQKISAAGGLKAYVEAEVQKQFSQQSSKVGNATVKSNPSVDEAIQNEIRQQVTKEVGSQIKSAKIDPNSVNTPLTADQLQHIWSDYLNGNGLMKPSSRSHFILGSDTSGMSADNAFQDVMKDNLTRDNPNGYKDFKNGQQQYKDMRDLDVFKNSDGTPKTFMNSDDFIKFAVKNWDAVQKLDPQTRVNIQQTLASQILHDAIDNTTKTVNTEKLQESMQKYKNYFPDIPQIKQILNENTLDLSKLATNNPDLQAQVAKLYGKTPEQINASNASLPAKETEITQTEQQLKNAQQAQKVVGTDPQEILTNISNIKSQKDFDNFLANSAEKDPVKIGQLVKQDAFERNNPSGKLTIEGMVKTYEELNNAFSGKGVSTKIKSQFFSDTETEIQAPLRVYEGLAALEKTIPKTSTALGKIAQGIATGVTYAMGWHFQIIRFGAHLLSSPKVNDNFKLLNEDDFRQVIDDKNTPAKAKTILDKIKTDYLLMSSAYTNTKKNQQ